MRWLFAAWQLLSVVPRRSLPHDAVNLLLLLLLLLVLVLVLVLGSITSKSRSRSRKTGKPRVRHRRTPFTDPVEPVGREPSEPLDAAERPAGLQGLDLRLRPEAEGHAGIALGAVAAPAMHPRRLAQPLRRNREPGANGVPVAPHSFQAKGDPVVVVAAVVPVELQGTVLVDHGHIDVAVVIVIADRQPACHPRPYQIAE